jgi:hypothetical protein
LRSLSTLRSSGGFLSLAVAERLLLRLQKTAANHAIGPAHLFDLLQAFFVLRELLGNVYQVHRLPLEITMSNFSFSTFI